MKTNDPIITALASENIVDPPVLEKLIESQRQTGQSILSILRQEKLLSEEQILLSLIHISEPTRLLSISYAVFCLKKNNPSLHSS